MSLLSAPYFQDEAAAFEHVERTIWPTGPVCHHCGCTGRISAIKPNPKKRVRFGLKKCGDCKKQFTVRMGTIFEESKLPLHIWLQAIHLMVSSENGVSSNQLHRTLEITYKSAWFLSHRIREAMRAGGLVPFGTGGAKVDVDETYVGRDPEVPEIRRGGAHKMKIVSPIGSETGRIRCSTLDQVDVSMVIPIVEANLSCEFKLRTHEINLDQVMCQCLMKRQ